MKDHFSDLSGQYAQFRPHYPPEVFEYLSSIAKHHDNAWDCATGNGQVARGLSPYFKKVMATDISEKQIQHAFRADNIFYGIEPAERPSFYDDTFDLITVGQAVHWFDFDAFYKEVKRVGKDQSIFAALGYDLVEGDAETNKIIQHFMNEVLKGFWDEERRYVDEHYETIPFPFKELPARKFRLALQWTAEQLLGFLSSWSAVKHYRDRHQKDPVEEIKKDLVALWKDDRTRQVIFPILLRVGIIEK